MIMKFPLSKEIVRLLNISLFMPKSAFKLSKAYDAGLLILLLVKFRCVQVSRVMLKSA